jgi:hypothetical protein
VKGMPVNKYLIVMFVKPSSVVVAISIYWFMHVCLQNFCEFNLNYFRNFGELCPSAKLNRGNIGFGLILWQGETQQTLLICMNGVDVYLRQRNYYS